MSEQYITPEGRLKIGVSITLPWFTVCRLFENHGKLCELPICMGQAEATHRILFRDGSEVLICDRHAVGILALGEYITGKGLTEDAEK